MELLSGNIASSQDHQRECIRQIETDPQSSCSGRQCLYDLNETALPTWYMHAFGSHLPFLNFGMGSCSHPPTHLTLDHLEVDRCTITTGSRHYLIHTRVWMTSLTPTQLNQTKMTKQSPGDWTTELLPRFWWEIDLFRDVNNTTHIPEWLYSKYYDVRAVLYLDITKNLISTLAP